MGARDHEGGEGHVADRLTLVVHPSGPDPEAVQFQDPEKENNIFTF